jgi:hypothetical protein
MLLLQFAIEPVTAILVVLERQGLVIIGELIRVAVMVGIWLAAGLLRTATHSDADLNQRGRFRQLSDVLCRVALRDPATKGRGAPISPRAVGTGVAMCGIAGVRRSQGSGGGCLVP